MSTEQLAEKILSIIGNEGEVDTMVVASRLGEDHQKIVGAVKSLQALGDIITAEPKTVKGWELTEEGRSVVASGSHEALVYNAVPEEGIPQATLMASVPNAKVGFSKAMSSGWIALDKTKTPPLVIRKVPSIEDSTQASLKLILDKKYDEISDLVKQEFKKRKLLQETVTKSSILKKGENFSLSVQKMETDLTAEMLAASSWKEKKFKPYNFKACGRPLESGHLHPLLKVKREFRNIFLEMGFEEMPTNNFVESSFWNFDALFQPQQHPARDAHDTFFLSSPKTCPKTKSNFPEEFVEKVKNVHSKGGYNSAGYGYDWKFEEAEKNLLRTHTTAVSARMLYQLAQAKGGFQPVKYFSIDRVFRNETLDATHLAEFQQVEGVIADYNLSLGDLIGILYTFFEKLGMKKLLFKPAYNPYTEPSMEIFIRHDGLDKWIEVGNSGIFRPEMLRPMGLPKDVNVIAWGLSLERPTMIKYGINNIRELVGPKVDLSKVFNSPLCRIAK